MADANLLEVLDNQGPSPAHGPPLRWTWLAVTFDHRVRNRLANDRFNMGT